MNADDRSTIRLGDLVVDLAARSAGATTLTPTEVALLGVLAAADSAVVERLTPYQEVWGYRREPQGRALDFAVMRLQRS